MKKVYYIFDTPPLESYYERYAMDYLCEKGIEVHVIDLSPIIDPMAYASVTAGLIKDVKREIFYDKLSFKKYAKFISDGAFFIFTTDFIYDIYFVYKCIRKTQYYGYFTRMDTCVEPDKPASSDRVKGLIGKDFFHHVISSAFIRIPRNLLPIKAADFFFLGGLANKDDYIKLGYTDAHTKICHIHSMDYEVYMKARAVKTRLVREKYCVFLDQYIGYHPDGIKMGYDFDPGIYYEAMNKFLLLIEKRYGVKVIIALHPRANVEVCRKVYKEFEMRRFQTAELVKDCEFVIGHPSNSLSFAALFYKPVLLCMTTEMLAHRLWRDKVNKYAELYDTNVLNISTLDNILLPEKIDLNIEKYKQYIQLYHKANLEQEDELLGARLLKEFSIINGEDVR